MRTHWIKSRICYPAILHKRQKPILISYGKKERLTTWWLKTGNMNICVPLTIQRNEKNRIRHQLSVIILTQKREIVFRLAELLCRKIYFVLYQWNIKWIWKEIAQNIIKAIIICQNHLQTDTHYLYHCLLRICIGRLSLTHCSSPNGSKCINILTWGYEIASTDSKGSGT